MIFYTLPYTMQTYTRLYKVNTMKVWFCCFFKLQCVCFTVQFEDEKTRNILTK